MQVKVAPVSSTNLYGPCPLIFTGTMIAASFGAASAKGTSPVVVDVGVPKSPDIGIVHAAGISAAMIVRRVRRWRITDSFRNDLLNSNKQVQISCGDCGSRTSSN